MKDEYGIPLDKPWREVRFYDEYDEHLQPIGEPMNLMDWQAHLQSELGRARLKIRKLEADNRKLQIRVNDLERLSEERRQLAGINAKLWRDMRDERDKWKTEANRIYGVGQDIEADNAVLKESAYLADVAFQSLKEHHDFHFGKLEEELNSLQQGYLGRGDAIRLLHAWSMDDKNKIGELEQEIKERDQSFDLYHAASMRGIKMWQEATGRDMEWPDQGHLTVWLLEKLDTYGKLGAQLTKSVMEYLQGDDEC